MAEAENDPAPFTPPCSLFFCGEKHLPALMSKRSMSKSELKAEYMASASPDLGVSDDATRPAVLSKKMQIMVTYIIGGLGSAMMWPHLEGVSKGLVILFALLAGMSINNGTVSGLTLSNSVPCHRCSEMLKGCPQCSLFLVEQWMANARDLRREQRDQRREALRDAKKWMVGSS
jgi:hypothetical protein